MRGKSKEHPTLVSQGLDNEIRRLCGAESFLKTTLENVPEGSCDHKLVETQLEGVRGRLKELGINGEIILFENDEDINLIDYSNAGVAWVPIALHYIRQIARSGLKIEDAGRWKEILKKRIGQISNS